MTQLHGFKLVREEKITEYNLLARLYQHTATGAELLSVSNHDENKVFGVTFRTPPSDSTGVAHILEHSVLCGSRKYPVKEPFVELLKGSLQTFLNAFTYPDKTCYPVASQNLKDFYNLIDIYMDAAFHPLIDRHTFDQEAWHYELNAPEDNLIYKGVVFNEMKGVYASVDNLLEIHSQRALFPDVTYGFDYGGDPRHIPDLTWEQLVAFHKKFYQPSNARIYFYGDDDPVERLRIMDEYLKEFSRQPVDSTILLQPRGRILPPRITLPYPANEEDDKGLLYLTVNWRLTENRNPEETLGLFLLDHILAETPASPLRKALIDSGLGEDLAGAGLESHVREMYFSTGMKGIKPGKENDVECLIDHTLKQLVADGIDPKTIEASINSEEFSFRELNTGNYPRGLSLMVSALQTWLYDGDPFDGLRYQAPLDSIKRRIAAGERYFESLILTWLVDNPCRTTLLLLPDGELKNRLDREEAEKLAAVKNAWSKDQIADVIAHTEELRKKQAMPDSPEALRCIPHLSLSDLDPQNKILPIEHNDLSGTPFLFHDIFTQGISYLDTGFNLAVIPDDLLSLVGIWARAVLETGTAKEDFVSLTQRMGRLTGGIEPELFTTTVFGTRDAAAWVFLRGKAIDERLPDLLEILHDILDGAQLGNRERIRQIIAEEKAGLESSIIPSGHRFVAQRLRAGFNTADWIQEQMGGLSYLEKLRALSNEMENDWPKISGQLMAIHRLLTSADNMLINLTADGSTRAASEKMIVLFLTRREKHTSQPVKRDPTGLITGNHPAGFVIPAQVNYVGKSINLHHQGIEIDGHALVVNRYLRTAWLWDKVRVQGGAYGAFSMLDYRSGQLTMVSYRDPNVANTLAIYDQTGRYLRELKIDRDEITRAIVGAIGDIDSHLLPDAKGFVSLNRHLAMDTDAYRQQLRREVLSTESRHFREFGEKIEALAKHGRIAVMGSKDGISSISGMTLTHVL